MLRITAEDLERKEHALAELLQEFGSVVVAYSGGVDSAYLARMAVTSLGRERVLAVTGRSPSYSAAQRKLALDVVSTIGLPHQEIETHELDDPGYATNGRDRCYFCKTELFSRLAEIARQRGAVVVDGTNADDLADHRPGLLAARQWNVRAPLQEVGLTKDEIRVLSRRAGLRTWDMAASPCLASRIAHGLRVTPARLARVETAEARLASLRPWRSLRVRYHGELGRLEVAAEDLACLADRGLRAEVARALRQAGFERASIDLEGYQRGSLNASPDGEGASSSRVEEPGADSGRDAKPGKLALTLGMDVEVDLISDGTRGEIARLMVRERDIPRVLGELRVDAVTATRSRGYIYAALHIA